MAVLQFSQDVLVVTMVLQLVVSGCAACDDLMIVMVVLQFSLDAPVVMMVLQVPQDVLVVMVVLQLFRLRWM